MPLLWGPLRLLGMLVLLVIGLAIAALVFPRLSQSRRNRTIRAWSRWLVAVCGLRVRARGDLPDELARTGLRDGGGRLLLANHVSWIDIFALNAVLPTRFVAKAEIGRWPVMGWLVTLAGTLYIERGRRHAVHALNQRVHDRLRAGELVTVFPEGTTSDGLRLLPFHSNLLAPAIEAGCEIWPVALRYTQHGQPSLAASFVGEMTLAQSIWRIVSARGIEVEVAYLAPLATAGDVAPTRHRAAEAAWRAIAAHLGLPERADARHAAAAREVGSAAGQTSGRAG